MDALEEGLWVKRILERHWYRFDGTRVVRDDGKVPSIREVMWLLRDFDYNGRGKPTWEYAEKLTGH